MKLLMIERKCFLMPLLADLKPLKGTKISCSWLNKLYYLIHSKISIGVRMRFAHISAKSAQPADSGQQRFCLHALLEFVIRKPLLLCLQACLTRSVQLSCNKHVSLCGFSCGESQNLIIVTMVTVQRLSGRLSTGYIINKHGSTTCGFGKKELHGKYRGIEWTAEYTDTQTHTFDLFAKLYPFRLSLWLHLCMV